MGNKLVKRFSTSLIISEMKIKRHKEIPLHNPLDLLEYNRMKHAGEDVEKLELSYIAGRTVQWCSCSGKQFVNSQNVKRSYL